MAWKLLDQRDPSENDTGRGGGDNAPGGGNAAEAAAAVACGGDTDDESSVPPDRTPGRCPAGDGDGDGDGDARAKPAPRPSLLARHPSTHFDAVNRSNNSLSASSAGSNRRRRRARRIQRTRSKGRCIAETLVLAACAAGLIVGVAWHYSRVAGRGEVPVETTTGEVPPDYDSVEVDYGTTTTANGDADDAGAFPPRPAYPPSNVTDGNATTSGAGAGAGDDDNSTTATDDDEDDSSSTAGPGGLSPVELLERRRTVREALMAYTPARVLDDETPSPQRAAMDWMVGVDPSRLDPAVDPSFVQRYVLATLYYGLAAASSASLASPAAKNASQVPSVGGNSSSPVVEGPTGGNGTAPPPRLASPPLGDWTSGSSECSWSGVECGGVFVMHDDSTFGIVLGVDAGPGGGDKEGHIVGGPRGEGGAGGGEGADAPSRPVIGIDLSGLGLRGTLPEEIGALLSLKSFDVSRNELEGPIPTTFGLLGNLMYLRLNNNTLSGNIPESIGNLVELRELEFGHNNLTGSVPKLICDLDLPDFGRDYRHSLPGVECSCCVGAGGGAGGGGGENDTAAPQLIGDSDAPSINDTSGEQPAPPPPPPTVLVPNATNTTTGDVSPPSSISSWSRIGPDLFGASGSGRMFGSSVSVSSDGGRIAVAYIEVGDGTSTGRSGRVEVYDYKHMSMDAGNTNSSTAGGSWTLAGGPIDVESEYFTVCMSGSGLRVAVLWATGETDLEPGSGMVRVYEYQEGREHAHEWVQVGGHITGEALSVGPVSLSRDGRRLAVGSPYHDGDKGHVDVYEDSESGWTMIGTGMEGREPGSFFGMAVSLSATGGGLAVGAPGNANRTVPAAVSVYALHAAWTQLGSDIVSESDKVHEELAFGHVVSIAENGTIVAVGAPPIGDESQVGSGEVNVYQYAGTAWKPYGTTIKGSKEDATCSFSIAMSADGNVVVVGCPCIRQNDRSGRTHVFHIEDDAWVHFASTNGTAPGDNLGYDVATTVDGKLAISGAPMADSDGRGYVRVEGYMDKFS